jgi:hypothetical protein
MPSSIIVGGRQVYRSGVYGKPDTSALSGRTLANGVLAVIGEFHWMEQGVASEFISESEMRRDCPGDDLLDLVSKCCWDASADSRVGQPAAVFLVSAMATTQATKTLVDANAAATLQIDAAKYGPSGNKTRYVFEAGTVSGQKITIQVLGGDTESYDNVEYPDVLTVQYTGAELDAVTMTFVPSTALTVAWQKNITGSTTWAPAEETPVADEGLTLTPSTPGVAAFDEDYLSPSGTWTPTPSPLPWYGAIAVQPDIVCPGGQTFEATVSGINAATGLADTELLSWAPGGGAQQPTTILWTSITNIVFVVTGGLPNWNMQGLKCSGTLTATIAGIDSATGLAGVEVLNWSLGEYQAQTTTILWSSITSIITADSASVPEPNWTVTANAFVLTTASYTNASQMADKIALAAMYTAETGDPKTAAMVSTLLDAFPNTTILGVDGVLTANLQAIIDETTGSQLATFTRATGGTLKPANTSGFLSGGAAVAAAGDDWTTAYEGLENVECTILVPLSVTESVLLKQRTHITYMCGAGAFERAGWGAVADRSALSVLKAAAKAQNTRHHGIVYQSPDIYDYKGNLRTLTPEYFALISAAMEAGLKRGSTLLRKRPNVVDLHCNAAIKPTKDADTLIKASIVTAVKDRVGWRYERTITTHREDDNAVDTEKAANRSMNDSITDAREYLIIEIGEGTTASAPANIRSTLLSRLDWQVKENILSGYTKSSVLVSELDGGGGYSIDYDQSVVGPVNFIVLNPRVTGA